MVKIHAFASFTLENPEISHFDFDDKRFNKYVRAYFIAVKQCINVGILRPNKTQNYDQIAGSILLGSAVRDWTYPILLIEYVTSASVYQVSRQASTVHKGKTVL